MKKRSKRYKQIDKSTKGKKVELKDVFELVKKNDIGRIKLDYSKEKTYSRNNKQVEFSTIKWGF